MLMCNEAHEIANGGEPSPPRLATRAAYLAIGGMRRELRARRLIGMQQPSETAMSCPKIWSGRGPPTGIDGRLNNRRCYETPEVIRRRMAGLRHLKKNL